MITLSFQKLEDILYRENSIIASEDVPILLDILCQESKTKQRTPKRVLQTIEWHKKRRGDG